MARKSRKAAAVVTAPEIDVTCRAAVYVRLSVESKYSHSESINVEFEKPFELDELIEVLKNAPGVVVQNDSANNEYPMAVTAAGKDEVFIGRIRRDESVDSGVNLWVVADNIRKGAATNAVQIAEEIVKAMNK